MLAFQSAHWSGDGAVVPHHLPVPHCVPAAMPIHVLGFDCNGDDDNHIKHTNPNTNKYSGIDA